jgi:hypothetical protein
MWVVVRSSSGDIPKETLTNFGTFPGGNRERVGEGISEGEGGQVREGEEGGVSSQRCILSNMVYSLIHSHAVIEITTMGTTKYTHL